MMWEILHCFHLAGRSGVVHLDALANQTLNAKRAALRRPH
jgi:hypothetical protein